MIEMLEFKSPIRLEGFRRESRKDYPEEVIYMDLSPEVRGELFTDMRNYLDSDFDSPRFGRGLARYLPEDIGKVVISVTLDFIEVDGSLYTEIVCTANRELNDTEVETLRGELTGQFSDGFGESFEQHEFDSSYDDFCSSISVNMWNARSDWNLELVKRITL